MGTITSTPVPTALSVLTAPGAPLATGTSLINQSVLNSASPADLASLSSEATALSEENGLFGLPTPDYGQVDAGLFSIHRLIHYKRRFRISPGSPLPRIY